MATESVEIPPLLTAALEGKSPASGRSVLPKDLDDELRSLARRARRECVVPILSLKCRTEAAARRDLETRADALAGTRLEMVHVLTAHLARDPFLMFALLGEAMALLKAERLRMTVRADLGGGNDQKAWSVFRAALDAYALGLRQLGDRLPLVLRGLTSGRRYEPSTREFDWRDNGVRLNRAMAQFELGVLLVMALNKRRRPLKGPVFRAAARLSWKGSDEAYVLLVDMLRRMSPAAEATPSPPPTPDSPLPVLSDTLFDDWAQRLVEA